MRVSKVSLAVILAMTFSAAARSQDSTIETVGQPSTSQLRNSSGQSQKSGKVRVSLPVPKEARLLGVRISAEESSSRIELKTAALAHYSVGRLSNPDRLYVHLLAATIDPQLKTPQVSGQDPLVSGIRVGNYEDSVTRIVFNLKSPANYQISELPGGSGVIIDLTSEAERGGVVPNTRAAAIEPETGSQRNVPSEKQSLSAAISEPEISAPFQTSSTPRTPLATPSEPAARVKEDKVDTINKRSVVAVGSFPSGKDLPIAASLAVPAVRNRTALGEVGFPAVANESPNATSKAKSDVVESLSSTANNF